MSALLVQRVYCLASCLHTHRSALVHDPPHRPWKVYFPTLLAARSLGTVLGYVHTELLPSKPLLLGNIPRPFLDPGELVQTDPRTLNVSKSKNNSDKNLESKYQQFK